MVQQQIIDTIKAYETIIIHRHVRPDADALGSQCGLKQILTLAFPDKNVYAVGEEDPSLQFLARMDQIDDHVYDGALVIVCDTANTGRVCDQRYKLGDQVIKIDHHPNVDPYGHIIWVDTNASSTSEMIYSLFLTGKEAGLQMDETAARLIYAGIVGDTGRFLFPSTTRQTFRYAAQLIEYPFDRQALYDGLYSVSPAIARLRGYILERYKLNDAGLATISLTKEVLESHQIDPIDTGKVVGTLGDIEGIRVWVFFIEETDIIRVRIRSKGPVINQVAAAFNGGGHPLASGASVSSWEEANQVIDALSAVAEKEA